MELRLGKKETQKHILALGGAVLVTLVAIALAPHFREFQKYGYIGAFWISIISSATVILPVPGFAIVFALSRFLDPLTLGIVAGLGAGLGEITGYLAGYSGSGIIEKTKFFRQHKEAICSGGPLVIFALAAIPNPFFDVAGIAAGAVELPAWQFVAAAVAGNIIKYVVLAETGAYVHFAFLR